MKRFLSQCSAVKNGPHMVKAMLLILLSASAAALDEQSAQIGAEASSELTGSGRARAAVSVKAGPVAHDASTANTKVSGSEVAAPPRQSRYQDGAGANAEQSSAAQKSAGVVHVDKQSAQKILRPATPALNSNSSHTFSFFDAGVSLGQDSDFDGYYRSFTLRFDADVSVGSALVYAKVYTRRAGASDWEWFYTTSDFWINGTSELDDFYLEATLDSGYPTGKYDVLIDLYESGFAGTVATITPNEDGSLYDLPLEDAEQDLNLSTSGFSIGSVTTELLTDNDHDGYYSRFRVSFDPDSDVGTQSAYVVLWVRAENGSWLKEHTSAVFTVYASGSEDRYHIQSEWFSGYVSSRYDMEILVYDAATNMLVARAASERPELSRVPLEDLAHDPVSTGGGGVTVDEHGGGGSVPLFATLLGLVLALARVRAPRQTRSRA